MLLLRVCWDRRYLISDPCPTIFSLHIMNFQQHFQWSHAASSQNTLTQQQHSYVICQLAWWGTNCRKHHQSCLVLMVGVWLHTSNHMGGYTCHSCLRKSGQLQTQSHELVRRFGLNACSCGVWYCIRSTWGNKHNAILSRAARSSRAFDPLDPLKPCDMNQLGQGTGQVVPFPIGAFFGPDIENRHNHPDQAG